MRIIIAPHNPLWKTLFEEEKAKLEVALQNQNALIEHIGSTAVENLDAKPIIDIMIGIPDFSVVDQTCVSPIRALGYDFPLKYQNSFPKRRYFRKWKDNETKTHHIHLTEIGCPFWERHLFFRDHLRNNPEVRIAYQNLKYHLAEQEWDEMNSYADAKTEFIRSIESKMK